MKTYTIIAPGYRREDAALRLQLTSADIDTLVLFKARADALQKEFPAGAAEELCELSFTIKYGKLELVEITEERDTPLPDSEFATTALLEEGEADWYDYTLLGRPPAGDMAYTILETLPKDTDYDPDLIVCFRPSGVTFIRELSDSAGDEAEAEFGAALGITILDDVFLRLTEDSRS